MCGIAGIYRLDGQPVRPEVVQRMVRTLAHRGPDDMGLYIHRGLGIGNVRLAILDLSSAGHQPMSNEDGSLYLVYNGEIYNFKELRQELEVKGHRFRSQTDTEVVLHAYEEWGIESLQRFNGMFAFALWDERRKRLLLARDPLGIKPLFYRWKDGVLHFGSEIKAILADPEVSRVLEEALHLYLTYYYVPHPWTLFKDIVHLLPGHFLLLEEGWSLPKIQKYWDWEPRSDVTYSVQFYITQLEDILKQSIKRTLVSDVPFGVFLSGGLDSSTVLHYTVQFHKESIHTFSVGFDEPSYNELKAARIVAKHYRTIHHETIVRPQDVIESLPRLVWHADEPLGDASLVPTFFVSKLAREYVKMALCGDGGDELFAGYDTYTAYFLALIYRRLPRETRRWLHHLVTKLPINSQKYSFEMKAKRFTYAAELPVSQIHAAWRVAWTEKQKEALYTSDFAFLVRKINPFEVFAEYIENAPWKDPLHRLLYADLRLYLPSDLLAKVDRASMACSLEVRVPLLDIEIVRFMALVPPSLKLRWWVQKKYLLKKVIRKYLPEEIIKRAKQGFVLPVRIWLKRGALRTFAEEILLNSSLYREGIFQKEIIYRFWKDYLEGYCDCSYGFWSLLVLFLWFEQFFRKNEHL